MNGYDNALSVLCQRVHSPDKESKNISAHILDLSLQMIDFLCMCGDVEKAILRVNELLCPATDLGTSGHILLSDILPCLSISDRCIFWICCIYVVIYRKLPEGIIQLFELEKDLPFVIEWPTAHLSKEDKYRALQLMEKAAVTLTSDDSNLCEKDHSQDNVRRSAHFLAISHVKCVAMLDGIHSATGLLAKYVRMYPSCVELVMISVRLQKISTKESFIEGFEEALHNWPREIPGCQCLWNQYAEYALEYGRVDFAEKLMELWFHSFCETQTLQCGEEEARLDGLCDSHELPSSLSPGASFYSSKKDTVFGLLNLCLYKLLQKNMEEARYAVDKALDLATKDEFRHCVREHAAFLFSSGSIPLIDRPHTAILDLLDNYLRDIRSCSTLEPLSRRFYWSVKKPKLRQLISSLLGPVSLDFSLLNSVLEVLYGPSLLPETFEAPKDLVDYVESLITIIPANYRLALSVYNFICKNCSRDAFASEGIRFWVSSLLANSIFQSFPVAPESVWLEAANILSHLEIYGISEAFHQQAVSVYPFSLKLWQSYFNLSKTIRNVNAVVEVAKRRGFELS
uniref:60S ribosomal protein L10 n=2 Tax=Anthurium amnicola TaxID=1678845 RepID=A0A1D1XR75_9ARAE